MLDKDLFNNSINSDRSDSQSMPSCHHSIQLEAKVGFPFLNDSYLSPAKLATTV